MWMNYSVTNWITGFSHTLSSWSGDWCRMVITNIYYALSIIFLEIYKILCYQIIIYFFIKYLFNSTANQRVTTIFRKILPFIQESRLVSYNFVLKFFYAPPLLNLLYTSPVPPKDQTGFNKGTGTTCLCLLYIKSTKD